MESAVKDTIVQEASDDTILERLIWLTLQEVASGDKLFPTPLEEPFFYQRYFKPWVREGLEEHKALKQSEEAHVQGIYKEKFST